MIKKSKAQEEMVGFALIVTIVSIIMLVFLSIYLLKPQKEKLGSYEVEGFINSVLKVTTSCESSREAYFNVENLIYECYEGNTCGNRDSCMVLNQTLKDIIKESWKTGQEKPVKGYFLNISVNGDEKLFFKEGNVTANSRGAMKEFPRRGNLIDVTFVAYS